MNFQQWGIKIKSWLGKIWRKPDVRVFFIIFAFGFIIFLPVTFLNYFSLPMNGDYVLQQVPFYQNAHDVYWHFFRTGEFTLYSYENYLGVNYFAANTFYYLTSPFSILIIICPKFLMPQLLFFSMILKMTVGGYFFYLLLKKFFNLNERTAFLGGLIYAFCGWGMFYLWFNHLTDVLAIFPLTLIGAEYLIKKKKGWLLALSLFIMGLTNYFFLFTFAITNSLYILVRIIYTSQDRKSRENFLLIFKGALYFLIGIGLSSFILLPALSMLNGNPRLENYNYLINLLQYFFTYAEKTKSGYKIGSLKSFHEIINWKNLFGYKLENGKKVLGLFAHLFKFTQLKYNLNGTSSYFYMTWGNWDTLLVSNDSFDNLWGSMYITMPLGVLLMPGVIRAVKNKKYLDVLIFLVLVVLPFIPITYYLLHAFSQAYGRWQIFLMAMALIYTVCQLDKIKSLTRMELFGGLIFTLFMMSFSLYNSFNNELIENYRLYVALGQIGYAIGIFAIYFTKDQNKYFNSTIVYIVMADLLINTTIATQIHGFGSYNNLNGGQDRFRQQQKIVKNVLDEDPEFYRVFNVLANRNNPNLPMALGYKGLSTFHSVFEYGLNDFNNFAKINYGYNGWSMGVHEKRIYLETFLNVKYYIINNPKNSNITYPNLPEDFIQRYCTKEYCIYENPHHYALGTSFDNFISRDDFSMIYSSSNNDGRDTMSNDQTLLKYPIVEKDDVAELKEILGKTETEKKVEACSRYTGDEITAGTEYELCNVNDNYLSSGYYYSYIAPNTYEAPIEIAALYSRKFKYLDKVEYLLSKPIPANRLLNINIRFGPNMDITLYTTREELENKVNDPNINEEQKRKLNNTLADDCHIDPRDSKTYCQVTYDSHMIHWYNKNGDHKYSRGFYTPLQIEKIQVKFWEDTSLYLGRGSYTYSNYKFYQDYTDKLKEYPLENIKHSNNKISFTTNYDSQRLIMLSVPYNEGFTVKMNGKEVKKYRLTSGFIGLVSGVGPSEYQVSYFTPSLKKGLVFTLGSAFLLGAAILLEERKKVMTFVKNIRPSNKK